MLGKNLVFQGVGLILSLCLPPANGEIRVTKAATSTLGTDPEGSARLNGMSFQQDPLVTFNGW